MKNSSLLLIIVSLIILPLTAYAGSSVDISGTWVGSTEVPGMTEEDQITLELSKDGDSYSGTITDSMGMAQNAELEEVEFSDNTLSFNFTVNTDDGTMQVDVTLTVKGDTMTGSWSTEDGSSADIELEKQD